MNAVLCAEALALAVVTEQVGHDDQAVVADLRAAVPADVAIHLPELERMFRALAYRYGMAGLQRAGLVIARAELAAV